MPPSDSQSFLRELDMNGAERHGRPSNVARRVRAGARSKLKGVLDRRYTQLQIDPANLSSLSNSSSASLGDLCALAVQISSMAIHGIDFNFGKEPANSFTQDQHPDLRASLAYAHTI